MSLTIKLRKCLSEPQRLTKSFTSGVDIAASTNTKASVVLVFKADDKPIDYQNVTLVKHA